MGERTISAPIKRMEKIIEEQHKAYRVVVDECEYSDNLMTFIKRTQDRNVTILLLDEDNVLDELKWKVHKLVVKRPQEILEALVSQETRKTSQTKDHLNFYAKQSHTLLGFDFSALHKLVRYSNQYGDPIKALDTVRRSLLQGAFCEMMIKEPQDKSWSKIGGYEEIKRTLNRLLYLPLDRPEAAKSWV